MHTFSSIGDNVIPKSLKCTHSATNKGLGWGLEFKVYSKSLRTQEACLSQQTMLHKTSGLVAVR